MCLCVCKHIYQVRKQEIVSHFGFQQSQDFGFPIDEGSD